MRKNPRTRKDLGLKKIVREPEFCKKYQLKFILGEKGGGG